MGDLLIPTCCWGSGILGGRWNKRLWYCRKLSFCGVTPLRCHSPISLHTLIHGPCLLLHLSRCKESPAVVPSMGLELKLLPRDSIPCWNTGPIQHQASLVHVPHCSSSVHCVWGLQVSWLWREHELTKESHKSAKKCHKPKKSELLWGIVYPRFSRACNGPVPSSQWSLSRFYWQAKVHTYFPYATSLLSCICAHLPFC